VGEAGAELGVQSPELRPRAQAPLGCWTLTHTLQLGTEGLGRIAQVELCKDTRRRTGGQRQRAGASRAGVPARLAQICHPPQMYLLCPIRFLQALQ
jgi:hypothetical protein